MRSLSIATNLANMIQHQTKSNQKQLFLSQADQQTHQKCKNGLKINRNPGVVLRLPEVSSRQSARGIDGFLKLKNGQKNVQEQELRQRRLRGRSGANQQDIQCGERGGIAGCQRCTVDPIGKNSVESDCEESSLSLSVIPNCVSFLTGSNTFSSTSFEFFNSQGSHF